MAVVIRFQLELRQFPDLMEKIVSTVNKSSIQNEKKNQRSWWKRSLIGQSPLK